MRDSVYTTVTTSPGIHLRGLQREIGCAPETVRYHISRDQRICSKTIRGYRRVFPATLDSDLYKSLAALNHETRGPLLVHIHERSGETTSSLAKALQRPVSTVSRHLNILTDHGITAVSRQGVSRIYQTTPATDRSIARFGSSIIDRFTEAFIDTWEQF